MFHERLILKYVISFRTSYENVPLVMKMLLKLLSFFLSIWKCVGRSKLVWNWRWRESFDDFVQLLLRKRKEKTRKKYLAFNKIFPSKNRYLMKKLSCGPHCRNSSWWCKPSAQLPKVSHCSIFSLRCLLACLLDDRFRVLWTTHQGSQTAI